MWIVAPLQGSPKGDMTFTDHHAIDIYTDEESAREAVKSGLRSGDPLVGLFKLEGVYDADVSVQKVRCVADTGDNRRNTVTEFTQYRRKQIAELRPYRDGEAVDAISVSAEDLKAGSPKLGDMIARNPKNHADQWLVAAQYFSDNFEPV